MDQTRQEQQQNKKNNTQLLLRFLKGSKLLFVLSIACSALVTLVDMLNPQIIRAAIDNAIGGQASHSWTPWAVSYTWDSTCT